MIKTPRIIFAGTPDFAVPALERLVAHGLSPVAVFTQPDRPAGRGRKPRESPVKTAAASHQIPIFQPKTLKNEEIQAEIKDLEVDLIIVVAYGLILPPQVLDIPRFGCWNIHASLLPRWRGAAPIQRAIQAGDTQTGVCIMQMDSGLDTGPVFTCRSTPISGEVTGGEMHDRLASMGADALIECLEMAVEGRLAPPRPQDGEQATYAAKISKAEAQLDWQSPAAVLERTVRAFNPWPVAWCELGGTRLRIWKATAFGTRSRTEPGKVLAAGPGGIDVACGQGVLKLLEVQREGGRKMAVGDYLNAHQLP